MKLLSRTDSLIWNMMTNERTWLLWALYTVQIADVPYKAEKVTMYSVKDVEKKFIFGKDT